MDRVHPYTEAAIPETMFEVCWCRLKAEEVRTTGENLTSASAKQTMKDIARVWDQMADDLEKRLSKQSEKAWPERWL
jgi:hypothetical protein